MFRSLFTVALTLTAASAAAQSWPSKPVRMVVPYAAGGAVDAMARVFGQKYSEVLAQPVVIDHRPGAGGNIGSELVAKSAPDGYTWLVNTGGQAIAPALYRKLNYDAVKELAPVASWVAGALLLVTPPQVPVNSLKELLALAKSQPGKLNYGSTGIGGSPHLAQEMLKSMAGLDVVHVPYKGDAALFPALFTNEVQFGVVPSQTALAHVKSGKVRVLAVTMAKRSTSLPDVPTMDEAGVPGFEYSGYTALWVQGGTPRDIVRRISDETARVAKMPDVVKYYGVWGVEPFYLGTEAFNARYLADIEKFRKLIREANIPQVD